MKRNLTDRLIRGLKVDPGGRLEVSDAGCSGLRMRVSAIGSRLDGMRRVWAVEVRIKAGMKRKYTLGEYPEISLAEARRLANEYRSEARRGVDRAAVEKAERLAAVEAERVKEAEQAAKATTRILLDEYARIALKGLKSSAERQRQLESVFAEYMNCPLSDVSSAVLQAAIDAKAAEGKVTMGNRVRAAIRAFTNWAAQRGRIPTDIGERLQKAGKERPRDVILSLAEVRAIYQACGELPEPWRGVFRLAVLTGQRRGIICGLRWRDVREGESAIVNMGRVQKNGKTQVTHLSKAAWACLPEQGKPTAFVFGKTGGASNISAFKAKLDAILGDTVQPWTLHDLRTAFATALGERGVPEEVTDMVLNHSASASKASAVSRVYNMASRLHERKEALDLWAQLVTAEAADLVALHG